MALSLENSRRLVIGTSALVAISLASGSVFAAGLWNPMKNSKLFDDDYSTYGCDYTAGGNMYAADGAVVTTNKWNCLVAATKGIFSIVADWPVGKTSFVLPQKSSQGGYYVQNAMVGIKGTAPARFGWMDSDKDWSSDATAWKAEISYSTDPMKENSAITLHGHSGWVRVYNPADNRNDLLGWRKVDLASGATFDTKCWYRFTPTVNSGQSVLYPTTVQDNLLRFQLNTAFNADNGSTTLIRIMATDKTRYQNYTMPPSPDYDHMLASADSCQNATCAYGNGWVATIEELCLGRFGY